MMEKHKIAFIEFICPTTRSSYLENYGLHCLAAIAKQDGHDVNVFQLVDIESAKRVLDYSPDVLAFSSVACHYDSSLKIAEFIKNQNPHIKIIFGGSHTSSYPQGLEDALRKKIIDYGIVGEADLSFRELLSGLNNPRKTLEGLVFIDDGLLKINPKGIRIKNLDDLPFAYRDPEILSRTKIRTIMNPPPSQQINTATTAYSRGCPFNCTFCSSRDIWGRNVVWRSAKNVVDEIEELKEKYRTNTLFFTDLSFNSNQGKVKELCNELIKRKVDIKWLALARVATPDGVNALIDEDLLRTMYEAGCRKLGYGLESVIPEFQENFKKKIDSEMMIDIIEKGHKMGILHKGYMVMGHPGESKETIKKTLSMLRKIRFDEIKITFLTPFPGSEFYRQQKSIGNLITEDFSRYSTDEPVLKCPNLSHSELIRIRENLYKEYYRSQEYASLVAEKTKRFPELEKSYEEMHSF